MGASIRRRARAGRGPGSALGGRTPASRFPWAASWSQPELGARQRLRLLADALRASIAYGWAHPEESAGDDARPRGGADRRGPLGARRALRDRGHGAPGCRRRDGRSPLSTPGRLPPASPARAEVRCGCSANRHAPAGRGAAGGRDERRMRQQEAVSRPTPPESRSSSISLRMSWASVLEVLHGLADAGAGGLVAGFGLLDVAASGLDDLDQLLVVRAHGLLVPCVWLASGVPGGAPRGSGGP